MIEKDKGTNEFIAVKTIVGLLFGFIILFGLYIQLHGKISPGGGFQSGIIFTIGYILYDQVHYLTKAQVAQSKILKSKKIFTFLSSLGVLIYGSIGLVTTFLGVNFLDYSILLSNVQLAQQIGLFIIETGISITVFGSMSLIYVSIKETLI